MTGTRRERLAAVALVSVLLASLPRLAGADVVELTTGERVEGTVKQATPAGVVIDVGGRELRIRQDRILGISFEPLPVSLTPAPPPTFPPPPPVTPQVAAPAPPPPARAISPALKEALTALERLQQATAGPLVLADYVALVDEVKRGVERQLAAAAEGEATKRAVRAALGYHAFAAAAWSVYEARGDLRAVGSAAMVAECPALARTIAENGTRLGFNASDPAFVGLMTAAEGLPALRACAGEKMVEAERGAR